MFNLIVSKTNIIFRILLSSFPIEINIIILPLFLTSKRIISFQTPHHSQQTHLKKNLQYQIGKI